MSARIQALFVALASFIAAMVLTFGGALALGCAHPHEVIRAEARSAVLQVSDAIVVADKTCAALAREQHDADLANQCAKAYDEARANLVNVAKSVDAFDSGKARDVLCGTVYASDALGNMAELIAGAGGKVPPAIDDALFVARKIGGCS